MVAGLCAQVEGVAVSSTLPAAGGPLHPDTSLHHNSFVEPHPEGGGDAYASATAAGEASASAAVSDEAAASIDDPVVKEVRLLASRRLGTQS